MNPLKAEEKTIRRTLDIHLLETERVEKEQELFDRQLTKLERAKKDRAKKRENIRAKKLLTAQTQRENRAKSRYHIIDSNHQVFPQLLTQKAELAELKEEVMQQGLSLDDLATKLKQVDTLSVSLISQRVTTYDQKETAKTQLKTIKRGSPWYRPYSDIEKAERRQIKLVIKNIKEVKTAISTVDKDCFKLAIYIQKQQKIQAKIAQKGLAHFPTISFKKEQPIEDPSTHSETESHGSQRSSLHFGSENNAESIGTTDLNFTQHTTAEPSSNHQPEPIPANNEDATEVPSDSLISEQVISGELSIEASIEVPPTDTEDKTLTQETDLQQKHTVPTETEQDKAPAEIEVESQATEPTSTNNEATALPSDLKISEQTVSSELTIEASIERPPSGTEDKTSTQETDLQQKHTVPTEIEQDKAPTEIEVESQTAALDPKEKPQPQTNLDTSTPDNSSLHSILAQRPSSELQEEEELFSLDKKEAAAKVPAKFTDKTAYENYKKTIKAEKAQKEKELKEKIKQLKKLRGWELQPSTLQFTEVAINDLQKSISQLELQLEVAKERFTRQHKSKKDKK